MVHPDTGVTVQLVTYWITTTVLVSEIGTGKFIKQILSIIYKVVLLTGNQMIVIPILSFSNVLPLQCYNN